MMIQTALIYLVKALVWTEKNIQNLWMRMHNFTAAMWTIVAIIHIFSGEGQIMRQQVIETGKSVHQIRTSKEDSI